MPPAKRAEEDNRHGDRLDDRVYYEVARLPPQPRYTPQDGHELGSD